MEPPASIKGIEMVEIRTEIFATSELSVGPITVRIRPESSE
jgi:hypothetical protein